MKKGARILFSLLSLLVLMLCLPGFTAAEEQLPSPQTYEGTSSLDLKNGVDVNLQNNSAGSSLIREWDCTIFDNSNGNVGILGETFTYGSVDYLDVQVFLQRWNGSDWVDVTSQTNSRNNDSYVSSSTSLSVARGYSYRCRAVHNARNAGGINYTKTSVSSAITIN